MAVAQANNQNALAQNAQNMNFNQMLMSGMTNQNQLAQQGYAGIANLQQQQNMANAQLFGGMLGGLGGGLAGYQGQSVGQGGVANALGKAASI